MQKKRKLFPCDHISSYLRGIDTGGIYGGGDTIDGDTVDSRPSDGAVT